MRLILYVASALMLGGALAHRKRLAPPTKTPEEPEETPPGGDAYPAGWTWFPTSVPLRMPQEIDRVYKEVVIPWHGLRVTDAGIAVDPEVWCVGRFTGSYIVHEQEVKWTYALSMSTPTNGLDRLVIDILWNSDGDPRRVDAVLPDREEECDCPVCRVGRALTDSGSVKQAQQELAAIAATVRRGGVGDA